MGFMPGIELCKAIVKEYLEQSEYFMIFGRYYCIQFEQGIEVENGGESESCCNDVDSGFLSSRRSGG